MTNPITTANSFLATRTTLQGSSTKPILRAIATEAATHDEDCSDECRATLDAELDKIDAAVNSDSGYVHSREMDHEYGFQLIEWHHLCVYAPQIADHLDDLFDA